jgi:GNAT superfamily N-acetyltransferase
VGWEREPAGFEIEGVVFRPARSEEGPDLAAVFGAARAEMVYLPVLHSPEEHREFFSEQVLPVSWVRVGETEEAGVVAFCAVKGGWVDHLYVRPGMQGRGIGSVLLKRAMAEHPEGLTLWVFEENRRAQSLYERAGFVEVARTDGSKNEELQPDVRMQWGGHAE